MKAIYLINLFFLVLTPICFWRASAPLPEPLRNQTCDDRDPYESFVVFRWAVTSTFVPFALAPSEKIPWTMFGFVLVFAATGMISMLFNLIDLNRGDCINPEEKPLFLVWEYLPFDSIIVFSFLILLTIYVSVLSIHGIVWGLYMWIKIWMKECETTVTDPPSIETLDPPTYPLKLADDTNIPPPYPKGEGSKETIV